MEIQSLTALMSMMTESDQNGDGVLQFDEFSDLLLRIDPLFTSQVLPRSLLHAHARAR